jgi:muramidase (phage lysozyme)
MTTIPASARYLLDQIGHIETGTPGPQGYETLYGHNERRLKKPITQMTLREVLLTGPAWTRMWKSSAAGRYQFMNATLMGLARELSLDGDLLFDPFLQDRLGFVLLRRRGYDLWAQNKLTEHGFMLRLAMEWASFPVPYRVKGGSRIVNRGQSYYAGDGLNKALVSAERVETMLEHAHTLDLGPQKDPLPLDTEPVPDDIPPSLWAVIVAAVKAYLAAQAARKEAV